MIRFSVKHPGLFLAILGVTLLLFAGFAASNGNAKNHSETRIRRETQALYLASGVCLGIAALVHFPGRQATYHAYTFFLALAGASLYPFAHYMEAANPVAPDVTAMSEEEAAAALAAHSNTLNSRQNTEGIIQAVGGALAALAALYAFPVKNLLSTAVADAETLEGGIMASV